MELFSPSNISCIGVIGTGVQARMQIAYLPENIKCKKIKVWGRSGKSVEEYIKEMTSLGWTLDRANTTDDICLLYTSPSPRDATLSRMPSSA